MKQQKIPVSRPLDGPVAHPVTAADRNRALYEKVARNTAGIGMLRTGTFAFRTMEDAENLACLLARAFPEPEKVVTGLVELMFNAVEHGNLEIGFDRKKELLESGMWQTEIARRLADPAYMSRHAGASITRRDGGIYAIITDEGPGFSWRNYLRIDPARAHSPHGRGIAHARAVCFDKLVFNEKGNKAVAFVKDGETLSW